MDLVVVKNLEQGIGKAKEVLYEEVDNKTFLILAGGNTPRLLYQRLAQEEILHPAAVGLIDERYGEPFHANSNELMVWESGLLDYFKNKNVPFYSMLHEGKTREEDAVRYDEVIRNMFFSLPKSVLLLGLGSDGHIASIMPNRKDFTDPLFNAKRRYLYVSEIDDPNKYGGRITLTFSGISLIDKIIFFVFGKDKRKAIKKLFEPGPVEKIPARFFQNPEIAKKTVLITDQKI